MEKIKFTNKIYLGFVIFVPTYFLILNFITFVKSHIFIALLPIMVQIVVLFFVLTNHKYVKNVIKIYAYLFILSGGLLLLSQLLFLFSDPDKFNLEKSLKDGLSCIIGLIYLYFLDDFLEVSENKIE